MVDTKISGYPAASAGLLTHELVVNESSSNKKVTGDQLVGLAGKYSSVFNASVTTPAAGYAADTYLAGSQCLIPAATGRGALKVGSMYKARFSVSKTAAGLVAPIINVRFGTLGTTADTSIGTLTFAAQTAVIDTGLFEVFVTWRTVGTGTTATIEPVGTLVHIGAAVGLSTANASVVVGAVGAGHNSQLASAGIGLSVNGGTNAAWTIALVQAELLALV
jgi:hypothetical protein